MASLSRASQCHCRDPMVHLERKNSSNLKTGPSNVFSETSWLGSSRVSTASISRASGFSRHRNPQTGVRERKFAANSAKSSRPKVGGLGIECAVGGSQLFSDKPRRWNWREPAFRARCTAFGHSQADDGDSFMEEQGSAGDVTESLPPSQPSVASWVLRLWKVRITLLASIFLSMSSFRLKP